MNFTGVKFMITPLKNAWNKAMNDKIIRNSLITIAMLLLLFLTTQFFQSNNKPNGLLQQNTQIILYTKDGCRYCDLAKSLLDRVGIAYDSEDISNKPSVQEKLINDTGQRTVPYIFVKDQFIGGYSDLADMNNDGRLLKVVIQMQGSQTE